MRRVVCLSASAILRKYLLLLSLPCGGRGVRWGGVAEGVGSCIFKYVPRPKPQGCPRPPAPGLCDSYGRNKTRLENCSGKCKGPAPGGPRTPPAPL